MSFTSEILCFCYCPVTVARLQLRDVANARSTGIAVFFCYSSSKHCLLRIFRLSVGLLAMFTCALLVYVPRGR